MRNLVFCLSLLSSSVFAADYPIVIDPFATATPPGAKVSAAYMTLTNETDEAVSITETYSPSVPKVEIHLSKVVDDVAKMEKQDTLVIEPKSSLVLEPGSYHFMLMGLTEPLEDGKTVDIVLVTSAGEMLIELPIKKHVAAKAPILSKELNMDSEEKQADMDPSNMNHDNMNTDQMDQSKMDESMEVEKEKAVQ